MLVFGNRFLKEGAKKKQETFVYNQPIFSASTIVKILVHEKPATAATLLLIPSIPITLASGMVVIHIGLSPWVVDQAWIT